MIVTLWHNYKKKKESKKPSDCINEDFEKVLEDLKQVRQKLNGKTLEEPVEFETELLVEN